VYERQHLQISSAKSESGNSSYNVSKWVEDIVFHAIAEDLYVIATHHKSAVRLCNHARVTYDTVPCQRKDNVCDMESLSGKN